MQPASQPAIHPPTHAPVCTSHSRPSCDAASRGGDCTPGAPVPSDCERGGIRGAAAAAAATPALALALALAVAAANPCGSNCRAQMLAVVKEGRASEGGSEEANGEWVECEREREERWCRGGRGWRTSHTVMEPSLVAACAGGERERCRRRQVMRE